YLSVANKISGESLVTEFKFKLVVAVRRDLDMGKGKIAVQVAHATISVSEDDLHKLHSEAEELGLPSVIIQDRGLTQVTPGTATCLGIGPAPAELVDK